MQNPMKKIMTYSFLAALLLVVSCSKGDSERFKLLTGPTWVPVSLLANGVDATGTGGILAGFVGDAKFNTDGTGTFGTYTGTWMFDVNEEKIIIGSPSLPISITLNITELISTSLKLQGSFPDPNNLTGPPINVEMTFRTK
jgi:hypothetical protein